MIFFPHPEVIARSEADVPVNVPANERQQWFLNQVGAEKEVRAADLAIRWNVAEKTAKRDISKLKRQGIIEFVGPPKTGGHRFKIEGEK
ncbi:MAG: DeoR family transcriptional regulator [Desulfobacterales bacterium]|nr:DeoR family transcriptional regulator [Desulfobacterales bacterium]MBL7101386.1 DeoR family transcriptional regulator [Desulfobacteraceae bacterium]